MRRCVDCGADISHRRTNAYLCLSCFKSRALEHDLRWHREHAERGRESQRRQWMKRPMLCRSCGAPRAPFKWYCDPCRRAFHAFTCAFANKKYRAKLRGAA